MAQDGFVGVNGGSGRALGRALQDFPDLSDAEKELLKCSRVGQPCRLSPQRPAEGDLYNTIRSGLIRFLALGGDDHVSVHEHGIDLRGAYVDGSLDFRGAELQHSLRLENCQVHGEIDLRDATARQLDLTNSKVKKIEAGDAIFSGGIRLKDGFECDGGVSFYGTEIDGNLDCSGGIFRTQSRQALNLENAIVSGSVLLCKDFFAQGEVVLALAEIEGNLDCTKGRFLNPKGEAIALRADGVQVAGSVKLIERFEAQGEVRFPVSRVEGDFLCCGGRFIRKGGDALILVGASVGGRFALGPLKEASAREICVEGAIRLEEAHVRVLRWDGTEHISGDWYTRIDGFTYDRLSGEKAPSLAALKAWINKQYPEDLDEDFKPQPFEQLVKVLREIGHVEDARQIGFDKQSRDSVLLVKRASFLWRPAVFLWRYLFLEGLVGYGYRPHRAISLAILLWGASAFVFLQAAKQGRIVPAAPLLYAIDQGGTPEKTLAQTCRENWTECDDPRMTEYPQFNAYVYSADLILPIVSFDQEARWTPAQGAVDIAFNDRHVATLHPAAVRFLVWFEIVYGWVAGLILAAVFSGAIRKD